HWLTSCPGRRRSTRSGNCPASNHPRPPYRTCPRAPESVNLIAPGVIHDPAEGVRSCSLPPRWGRAGWEDPPSEWHPPPPTPPPPGGREKSRQPQPDCEYDDGWDTIGHGRGPADRWRDEHGNDACRAGLPPERAL